MVLTTHVNADGDGAGSEVAMAHYLRDRGVEATIVNPTPFPEMYGFLVGDLQVHTPAGDAGRTALADADLILALDTSEPSRMGPALASRLEETRSAALDHHPASPTSVGEPVVSDPSACATGELVHDLIRLDPQEGPTPAQARAIYVAIVTDTGSFRFSNTAPRTHELAAFLLRTGVDVEEMFRRLYGRYTPGGLALLARALSRLEVDPDVPVAWLSLRQRDLEETGADREAREGIVEYPRRLAGVEVAVLFRELPDGRTKVSLRSNGPADVAEAARSLGGGGHPRAAGVLLEDTLERAQAKVLGELRRRLGA